MLFFSLLVITVSFLPVFTLEGAEGRLFKPLAFTKTYSMGFARPARGDAHARAGRALHPRPHPPRGGEPGQPLADRASTRRWCASSCAGAGWWSRRALAGDDRDRARRSCALGSEFMPPLNEGAILYMPTAPPGMSVERGGARAPGHGPRAPRVPRGGRGVRQDGPRRDRHRPGADRMVETVVRAQAAGASGAPGSTWDAPDRRDGRRSSRYPGHAEHLVDADPDPHRDALDRHPQPARRSRCSATTSPTIERAAVEIERRGRRQSRARAAPSPTARPAASTSTSRSTARRRRATASGSPTSNDVVDDRDRRHGVAETVEGRERYPIARPLRARLPRRPARLERVLVAHPVAARQVPLRQVARIDLRHRPADDPQRGRPAGRLRLRRPRRAPDRRLRRARRAGRGRAGDAAARRAHRVGRASSSTSSAPARGSSSWCR